MVGWCPVLSFLFSFSLNEFLFYIQCSPERTKKQSGRGRGLGPGKDLMPGFELWSPEAKLLYMSGALSTQAQQICWRNRRWRNCSVLHSCCNAGVKMSAAHPKKHRTSSNAKGIPESLHPPLREHTAMNDDCKLTSAHLSLPLSSEHVKARLWARYNKYLY